MVFAVVILNQTFPAGLLIYWITTNLWTVGQALVIRHVLPATAARGAASEGSRRKKEQGASRPSAEGRQEQGQSRQAVDAADADGEAVDGEEPPAPGTRRGPEEGPAHADEGAQRAPAGQAAAAAAVRAAARRGGGS